MSNKALSDHLGYYPHYITVEDLPISYSHAHVHVHDNYVIPIAGQPGHEPGHRCQIRTLSVLLCAFWSTALIPRDKRLVMSWTQPHSVAVLIPPLLRPNGLWRLFSCAMAVNLWDTVDTFSEQTI